MPFSVHSPGWQTRYPRLSASAHSNWTGPSRAAVFSAFPFSFYHLPAAVRPPPLINCHSSLRPFTHTGTWSCSTPLSRSVSARWRCWWTRWRCECLRRMDRLCLYSWALSGALLVRWALRCLRYETPATSLDSRQLLSPSWKLVDSELDGGLKGFFCPKKLYEVFISKVGW